MPEEPPALVDIAVAEQVDQRAGQAGVGLVGVDQRVLEHVEGPVDLFGLVGVVFEGVLEVGDAEGDVAGFVLRGKAEDALFGLVVSDQLAEAEERLDEAFAEDVEHRGHLGEVLGFEDLAQAAATALQQQAAAVGEGALAEDVGVARLVHHLRHQEESRLVVVGGDSGQPFAGHIAGDELDLGQRGAELGHRALDVLGQFVERVPGDVAGGGPLARDGFVVEQGGGVGEGFGGLADHVAHAGRLGGGGGAARARGVVGRHGGDFAVDRVVDLLQGESLAAGLGLHAPLGVEVEPGEVEFGHLRFELQFGQFRFGHHLRSPRLGAGCARVNVCNLANFERVCRAPLPVIPAQAGTRAISGVRARRDIAMAAKAAPSCAAPAARVPACAGMTDLFAQVWRGGRGCGVCGCGG